MCVCVCVCVCSERVECDIATMEREFKQKHSQKQEQVQLLLKELEQCYKENSALQLSKKQTTKGTHTHRAVTIIYNHHT